jgi:hypothetical protein
MIVPQLREQMTAGTFPLRIAIDDDDVGLDITIDPIKSPYSSAALPPTTCPR